MEELSYEKRKRFYSCRDFGAVAVFSIVIFGVANILDFQIKSFGLSSTRAQTQEYTRGISDVVTKNIRFTTYIKALSDIPAITSSDEYAYIF